MENFLVQCVLPTMHYITIVSLCFVSRSAKRVDSRTNHALQANSPFHKLTEQNAIDVIVKTDVR